eukprot:1142852-Pelagomonas_calceolata.AAC.6
MHNTSGCEAEQLILCCPCLHAQHSKTSIQTAWTVLPASALAKAGRKPVRAEPLVNPAGHSYTSWTRHHNASRTGDHAAPWIGCPNALITGNHVLHHGQEITRDQEQDIMMHYGQKLKFIMDRASHCTTATWTGYHAAQVQASPF